MSLEDSPELRQHLSEAWKNLARRLVEADHPPAAVVETMFTAAVERFAELHGSAAAANYLRLLAEQMLATDRKNVEALIAGRSAAK